MDKMVLQRSIISGIKAGRVDLKYAYLGENGAKRHLNHAKSDGYKVLGDGAMGRILVEYLGQRAPVVRPVELVDYGCGSGSSVGNLVDQLGVAKIMVSRLVLVDLSAELLDFAQRTLKDRFPALSIETRQSDLEQLHDPELFDVIRGGGPAPRVHLLLGGTLGNVPQPQRICRTIASYCSRDDVFMLGVARVSGAEQRAIELRDYNSANFLSGVFSPLAELVAEFGFAREDFMLETRYDPDTRCYFTQCDFERALEVVVGGVYTRFAKGTTVELFRSKRFLPNEAAQMLARAGWRDVAEFGTPETGYVCARAAHSVAPSLA